MRSVWLLCAGLLLGVLAGCDGGRVCATGADCDEGMRCTADGLCGAQVQVDGGIPAEPNGPGRPRRGAGRVFMQGVEDLPAWLSGQFGAQEVNVQATVEAYAPGPSPTLGDAKRLNFYARDQTTGMILLDLPRPLRELPLDVPTRIDGAVVCGDGVNRNWNYDTSSTDGTVLLTKRDSGGVNLELAVHHWAEDLQTARAHIQLPPL